MRFRLSSSDYIEENTRLFSRFLNHTSGFHPFHFGQILIRLGYEPWSPSLRHTPLSLVGMARPVYMYPWIGKYVWNLARDIGFMTVCTTGFACSCISSALMSAAEDSAIKFIRRSRDNPTTTDETTSFSSSEVTDLEVHSYTADTGRNRGRPSINRHPSIVWALRSVNNVNDVDAMRPENEDVADVIDMLCEERSVPVFVIQFLHLLLWRIYGIVISHPFRVIMVRQISYAAAGGSSPYTWFPQAALQVYRENGFSGFFQGLLPNLLAEVLVLSSVVNINRLLRLYLLDDCDASIPLIVRSILWIFHDHYIREPLLTVCDLLAVRGSGLNLPIDRFEVASSSWSQCWDYLVSTQQILRASSWFFRRRVPEDVIKKMQS